MPMTVTKRNAPRLRMERGRLEEENGAMSFGDALRTCFKKYADFSGRAARPEYWWFFLFCVLVYFGLAILLGTMMSPTGDGAGAQGAALLFIAALLGLVIPQLAAAVRRLHDTGKSGWWYLVGLVPYLGGIVLIVLLAQRGDPVGNQYGAPVGVTAVGEVPPIPPPPPGNISGSGGFTYP
jgi:uncharacterized membrane protein YhaH (DUF805 family)